MTVDPGSRGWQGHVHLMPDPLKVLTTLPGTSGLNGRALDVAGMVRSTDFGVPPSGQGLELFWHSPTPTSVIQSYDRGASAWRDLQINGRNIQFNPSGRLLLPAASVTSLLGYYSAGNAFATTLVSTWVTTTVTITVTTVGAAQMVWWQVLAYHSVPGALMYAGLIVDGGLVPGYVGIVEPAAGYIALLGNMYFAAGLAPGSHTFAVAIQGNTAGTMSLWGGAYSTIYVLDLRA
jgi:hypothetical protein